MLRANEQTIDRRRLPQTGEGSKVTTVKKKENNVNLLNDVSPAILIKHHEKMPQTFIMLCQT